MSNQNFQSGQHPQGYQQPPGDAQNNPWADEEGSNPHRFYSNPQPSQHEPYESMPSEPWQEEQSQPRHPGNPYAQQSQPTQQTQAPGRPEERALDFVPEAERGEQMETMQEFEMNRARPDSQHDLDVATLQKEYPDIDGSLIAAIYGDSSSLSATREMLQELGKT